MKDRSEYNQPGSRRIIGFSVLAAVLAVLIISIAWPNEERTTVLDLVWIPGLAFVSFVVLNETARPTGTVFPFARKFIPQDPKPQKPQKQ